MKTLESSKHSLKFSRYTSSHHLGSTRLINLAWGQVLYNKDCISDQAIIYWHQKGSKPQGRQHFLNATAPLVKVTNTHFIPGRQLIDIFLSSCKSKMTAMKRKNRLLDVDDRYYWTLPLPYFVCIYSTLDLHVRTIYITRHDKPTGAIVVQ